MKTFILTFLFVFGGYSAISAAPAQSNAVHKQLNPPAALESKKTLTIAVLDTGFGFFDRGLEAHLCKFGHKDFSGANVYSDAFHLEAAVPLDRHGHGTHIAGLIDLYASKGSRPFCLVIVKYYDPEVIDANNLLSTIRAIDYAKNIHADIINYSGGGIDYAAEEAESVRSYIDHGGTFIAAAGNERSDLAKHPYYPAMDDPRVIVVGNINQSGNIARSSNYGDRVSCYETGESIRMYDMYMTGTSQSTAIATGKFVAGKTCGAK